MLSDVLLQIMYSAFISLWRCCGLQTLLLDLLTPVHLLVHSLTIYSGDCGSVALLVVVGLTPHHRATVATKYQSNNATPRLRNRKLFSHIINWLETPADREAVHSTTRQRTVQSVRVQSPLTSTTNTSDFTSQIKATTLIKHLDGRRTILYTFTGTISCTPEQPVWVRQHKHEVLQKQPKHSGYDVMHEQASVIKYMQMQPEWIYWRLSWSWPPFRKVDQKE